MWTQCLSVVVALTLLAACELTLTQRVSPTQLETSERGAFTADGRFFMIATRSADKSDAGGWIIEVTKAASGEYVATDYVPGALEGTEDGTVTGAPRGPRCMFGGMTVYGQLLYAACYAQEDGRASLLQVDTQSRTVRSGYLNGCATATSAAPCAAFYPNGMAVDSAGRIYVSNTQSHISVQGDNVNVEVQGAHTLTQVSVDAAASQAGQLVFQQRDWFNADIFTDGFVPNGVQIAGATLYYAAGANINAITINADGSAGEGHVHYRGPALTMIDDFAIHDGRMALARILPPAVVGLERPSLLGVVRELATHSMPLDAIPSSITYQANVPVGAPLFPEGALVITSYFGGGLYVLAFDH
jgi:hypothetical protein